ncbi:hypothetical protein K6119_10330 [Paracrocinitomix mangrovi]|uniref:hypothetical protein n=1 Tax=Paracrocinitomix mangrovi TaxID=2862509 RepID=UPI001C8EF86E|nr:hypothetical protein [Paracrocinitomix mangrovi]UKN00130.1 hypothetical protein K6119_10330 [Paracrocinitomix mangrovi]
MIVLVNGLGNIGTTVANLLLDYKVDFGIDEVWAYKRKIQPWQSIELNLLEAKGIKVCSDDVSYPNPEDVLPKVNYIFECAANGVGLLNKDRYDKLPNLIGASAQGSEKGFGVSFMSGLNNELIKNEKFVHVVSCNMHGSAAIMRLFGGDLLQNLESADMVVVRRSEDIGNHQRMVSGNVVSRHLDEVAGTHHSIDVNDMFKSIGVDANCTASDITTPSQFLHSVRFNLKLKSPLKDSVIDLIDNSPLVSRTSKFDSNVVFEMGRRYGYNGRIFSHAIVLDGNLLITQNEIKGWAFVPQEGNTIISTIHAFLLQIGHEKEKQLINKLLQNLVLNQW